MQNNTSRIIDLIFETIILMIITVKQSVQSFQMSDLSTIIYPLTIKKQRFIKIF